MQDDCSSEQLLYQSYIKKNIRNVNVYEHYHVADISIWTIARLLIGTSNQYAILGWFA